MCVSAGPSPAHQARVAQITAAQDAAQAKEQQAATAKADAALQQNLNPPIAPVRMVDDSVQATRSQAITKARQAFGGAGGTLLTNGGLGDTDIPGQKKVLLGT
jgi:hypothetical protein